MYYRASCHHYTTLSVDECSITDVHKSHVPLVLGSIAMYVNDVIAGSYAIHGCGWLRETQGYYPGNCEWLYYINVVYT